MHLGACPILFTLTDIIIVHLRKCLRLNSEKLLLKIAAVTASVSIAPSISELCS